MPVSSSTEQPATSDRSVAAEAVTVRHTPAEDPVSPAAEPTRGTTYSRILEHLGALLPLVVMAVFLYLAYALVAALHRLDRPEGATHVSQPKPEEEERIAQARMQQLADAIAKCEQAVRQLEDLFKKWTAAGGNKVEGIAELVALAPQMKDLKTEVEAARKLLAELKADLNNNNETLVKSVTQKTAEKTAENVESVLERKMKRLDDLRTGVLNLEQAVNSFHNQLQREGAAKDVALIVYNSKYIDPNPLMPLVGDVVLKHPYRRNYTRYRLGIYVASEKAIVQRILELDQPEKPLGLSGPKDPKIPVVSEKDFHLSGTQLKDNLESVKDLPVDEQIFKKAKPGTLPRKRRCVFVISSQCDAPEPNDPRWKDIGVDVLILDPRGHSARKPEEQKRLDLWDAFCRGHEGVALPFRVPEKGMLSEQDGQAFKLRLQWLICPF